MKKQDDKCIYKCFNYFMLRTPVFPVEELAPLFKVNITPEHFIDFCKQNKIFKEALLINSSDTYNMLTKEVLTVDQKNN